ncbi:Tyrosine--tRNA ligase [compost metagenome]
MKWEELTQAQREEVDRQIKMISRGVVEIVPEEELKQKLMKSVVSGKPLNVKLGLDPSGKRKFAKLLRK